MSNTENDYIPFGHKEIARSRNQLSFTNLRLPEFGEIGADVEADSFSCSRERDATYQQNGQQDIGKQSCEVHHLQCNTLESLVTSAPDMCYNRMCSYKLRHVHSYSS